MLKTRVTELLGLDYPIIQGGMQWLATAPLAAAVSNAGGLGIISATSCGDKQGLLEEIARTKALTDRPFGVNISMLPTLGANDRTMEYVQAVLESGVKVVETAGRSPKDFIGRLKEAGVVVIHKVASVRFAEKAQQFGADMVTIVGYECGGHPGLDDVPAALLINKASRCLDIPLLLGGGVADGRSLLAALAVGAEGVVLGTRFVASAECPAHPAFKQWIAQAGETDTVIIERSIRNPLRAMNNEAAQQVLEMEAQGASLEQLMTIISGQVGKKALASGDLSSSAFPVGQDIGLIDDIPTAAEIIHNMVEEAIEIYQQRLHDIFA